MGTRIPLRGHQPFLGGILGPLGEVVAFVRSLKSVQIIDVIDPKFPMLPKALSVAAPELMQSP